MDAHLQSNLRLVHGVFVPAAGSRVVVAVVADGTVIHLWLSLNLGYPFLYLIDHGLHFGISDVPSEIQPFRKR